MVSNWKIEDSTHGMACKGCKDAAEGAIIMASSTGSVGATYNDNGNHAARVSRQPGDKD